MQFKLQSRVVIMTRDAKKYQIQLMLCEKIT